MELSLELISDVMILLMAIYLNFLIARLSQPMSEALGQRPWYLVLYVVAAALLVLLVLGSFGAISETSYLGLAFGLNLVSIVVAIKYWYWLPAECFRASRGSRVN